MLLAFKYLIIPFSFLYCAVTGLRNLLYDISFFKTKKINAFVISVGNVTTGGTGKTPFIISLAERLINKGHKVGIVSRGYKRSSGGMSLVCDGNSIKCDCSESGDELMMISKKLINKFPGKFITVADSDRIRASEYIINNYSADIILLDDAFQHRKIHRDFDIVLVDGQKYCTDKFSMSFCIPSGSLRERFGNLRRADLVILNNKFTDAEKTVSAFKVISEVCRLPYVLQAEYIVDGLFDLDGNTAGVVNENTISFSGIASDKSFKDALNLLGIKRTAHFSFNDHHTYSLKDLHDILKVNGNSLKSFSPLRSFLVTTEKDSVKLSLFSDFLSNHTIYYVGISIKTDWAEFDNILGNSLKALYTTEK